MDKEITIYQAGTIDKKNDKSTKNPSTKEEISHNFRKLIAEIMVEIMVKKKKNGRNRVYQDK